METQKLGSVSIVVPVFNSAQSIPELVRRISCVMTSQRSPFEILLINDGSRDSSWSVVQQLVSSSLHIRGINLTKNFGQHNALLCGIRLAEGEVIVTIDDDLQNSPEDIPKLIEKIISGADVVYGIPNEPQFGIWRVMASVVTKHILAHVLGAGIAPKISAFRAFKTNLRRGFHNYNAPLVNIDVLLTWSTSKYETVNVEHNARQFGKSNYTFLRLVVHALNMVTGFSTFPLRFASICGVICALFGVGVLFYVVGRYFLFGGGVAGFPFLASIIAIFSGTQLLSLGILGEYFARMYFRTMNRPAYLIGDDSAEDNKRNNRLHDYES